MKPLVPETINEATPKADDAHVRELIRAEIAPQAQEAYDDLVKDLSDAKESASASSAAAAEAKRTEASATADARSSQSAALGAAARPAALDEAENAQQKADIKALRRQNQQLLLPPRRVLLCKPPSPVHRFIEMPEVPRSLNPTPSACPGAFCRWG